jgi:hypothetical protein
VTLTAPFPWFGGKSRAADDVWRLLGADVTGYVEPFCGSLAVLLARPEPVAVETVNDADGFVANFWRAVSFDADAVAAWADWPVNEVDLEARHAWLVNRSSRLRWSLEDPDFYDAKIAGWWVWGACAWIGSGWCSGEGPHIGNGASIVDGSQLPHLGNAGRGINRKLPHLGDAGRGINRQLPHLGNAGQGEWLRKLQARIRRTRVACGDWSRVVTDSVLRAGGSVPAVFLDPPYGDGSFDYSAGGNADGDVARDVWAWATERPRLRVVVAAYEDGRTVPPGWSVHRWKARKGYQSADNKERLREVLYASPACAAATAQVAMFGEGP